MAVFGCVELDDIAAARHAKARRANRQTSHRNMVAPTLAQRIMMSSFMHERTFNGKDVIIPQALDVYESPLPPAE